MTMVSFSFIQPQRKTINHPFQPNQLNHRISPATPLLENNDAPPSNIRNNPTESTLVVNGKDLVCVYEHSNIRSSLMGKYRL